MIPFNFLSLTSPPQPSRRLFALLLIAVTTLSACDNNETNTITENTVDDVAPVITLNGDAIISHQQGEIYNDLGAVAIDNIDPSVTIIIAGEVDITKLGTYTITYTASDAANNTSTLTRLINIVDLNNTALNLIDNSNWQLSASNNKTELNLAIDSDPTTTWTTEENQKKNQWLEIDLINSYKLTAIELSNESSHNEFPIKFAIQVSDDGLYWADLANQQGLPTTTKILLNNIQAQHIRLSLLDNSEEYPWSIDELSLYGDINDNPPTPFPSTNEMIALEKIQNHILGTITLSSEELTEQQTIIQANLSQFSSNIYQVDLAFDLIDLYDQTYGALFTSGSKTDGGINARTSSGYELEHVVLAVMQGILDHSYHTDNLQQFPIFFSSKKFATSAFFPGSVSPATQEEIDYNVKVNGTHVRGFGIPANYETEDARRPTGSYLAPGSIATVTVPESLVNIGASILVGAHTWDLSTKPQIKRMDRVTTKYDIDAKEIIISNPLGGGIYINIPYQQDLGILEITLSNVVQSPYYANTAANQTNVTQWQNEERLHDAPWADFESDKVMMQIPTSWIYNMEDPTSMMEDWDLSMDAISELFARPLLRPKTAVYSQVDVIMRGSANFPGYPQSNITYDPDIDYGGDHDNFLINGPRNQTGYLASVFFHELGHAENFHKFNGEVEASVNFLYVAVQNKKFGVELNEAFSESRYNINHTIDEAAQNWMMAENFRNGNPMSNITGQFRQEFAYQPRGYAKYADIVRLFGWEALQQFFYNLNVDYENGVTYNYHVSNVPWDEMSLRLSIASGYDLTPLLHFWGIHPEDPEALAASIETNDLLSSTEIYDQLITYKTLPLQNNDAFRAFGLADFSEDKIVSFVNSFDHKPLSYYEGFLNAWWNDYDENDAKATQDQVQTIIDLYFPDGRP